jgi:hypothetical protein
MKVTYEKPTLTQVGKANDVILGICGRGDDLDGHLIADGPCPADLVDPLDPDVDL